MPRSGITGSYGSSTLNFFGGTSIRTFKVAAPIYIPTNLILTNTCYFLSCEHTVGYTEVEV